MNLPVKPLGHKVLIEVMPVQFKSRGGIIIVSENEKKREKKGREIGRILAFGPTAYLGFAGCDSPEDWGVKVGDVVELGGRYDGKHSAVVECDNKYESIRYVNDSEIIGVFSDEMIDRLQEVAE